MSWLLFDAALCSGVCWNSSRAFTSATCANRTFAMSSLLVTPVTCSGVHFSLSRAFTSVSCAS
jgi:hypothetical protein